MQDLDEKSNEKKPSRITRRKFVGAVGAAAALGTIALERRLDASPSEVYYYQNSFGDIAPVDQALLDLGVYPPAVPATSALPSDAANPGPVPEADTTAPSSGYPHYNILLIIVD
jgi:hypothetical protein